MTKLFRDSKGRPAVRWIDSKGHVHESLESNYLRNFDANEDEDEIKKPQSRVEKEKKVDEIAANEDLIKQKEKELEEKERDAIRSMSAEAREDLLDELREELKSLQTGTKEASTLETIGVNNDNLKTTKRHILKLNDINTLSSREGDKLMKLMGST